jgi:hypothetical protein
MASRKMARSILPERMLDSSPANASRKRFHAEDILLSNNFIECLCCRFIDTKMNRRAVYMFIQKDLGKIRKLWFKLRAVNYLEQQNILKILNNFVRDLKFRNYF